MWTQKSRSNSPRGTSACRGELELECSHTRRDQLVLSTDGRTGDRQRWPWGRRKYWNCTQSASCSCRRVPSASSCRSWSPTATHMGSLIKVKTFTKGHGAAWVTVSVALSKTTAEAARQVDS